MSEDLLFYAQLGRADHIARLVRGGIDPDWRREDGVTTLMMAAMTGRIEVMRSLLDTGATIDLEAPDGTTALLAACTFARTTREIAGVELLLARGADPNLANSEGNAPLMLCARHGLSEAAEQLLEAGADPLRKNRHGTTALMQAARGHLTETVRMLIRAGADRMATDERGQDALRYAYELGPPPTALSNLLAPTAPSLADLVCEKSTFAKPELTITLLGSWNEHDFPSGLELREASGERQVQVSVERFQKTLEADERHDALVRKVRAEMIERRRDWPECQFEKVRFLEADNTTQARWDGAGPALFVWACIYATRSCFVTMSYRDFRPSLSEETRRRQAGETVASFRVA